MLVEAYRQFSNPVEIYPHERYPILKGVELEALCDSRELIRGYLVYSSVYIISYIAILSSTELYTLVAEGSEGSKVVGSRGTPLFDETDYGKPIIISALIIAALSTGIFAPVERAIRGYSHRLAGIPRGVYRVISRLHRIDYDKLSEGYHLELASDYISALKTLGGDIENIEIAKQTRSILQTIDLIEPTVSGNLRDQLFTAFQHPAIEQLIEKVEHEIADLRAEIGTLNATPQSLQNFNLIAETTRNNVKALFAVLYIRNRRQIENYSNQSASFDIIKCLEKDRTSLIHSIAGATMFAAISSVVATLLSLGVLNDMVTGSETEISAEWASFAASRSFWNVVETAFVFAVVAATAVWFRDSAVDRGRWADDWRVRRFPWWQYLKTAFLPTLTAGFLSLSIYFLEEVWHIKALPSKTQMQDFANLKAGYCLLNALLGFVVTFCILSISDLHERLSLAATVALSLGWSILFVFFNALVVAGSYGNASEYRSGQYLAWIGNEVFVLGIPVVVFFVGFAILIEMTEDTQP